MRLLNLRQPIPLLPCLALGLAGCGLASGPAPSKPDTAKIMELRSASSSQEPPPGRIVARGPFREWDLRETTVDAIARIGEPAVPTLIQSLGDSDPRVRTQAARALARIGSSAAAAVPALTHAIGDRDETVRQAAVRALGQIGPAAAPALPELIEILRGPDAPPPAAGKAAG